MVWSLLHMMEAYGAREVAGADVEVFGAVRSQVRMGIGSSEGGSQIRRGVTRAGGMRK